MEIMLDITPGHQLQFRPLDPFTSFRNLDLYYRQKLQIWELAPQATESTFAILCEAIFAINDPISFRYERGAKPKRVRWCSQPKSNHILKCSRQMHCPQTCCEEWETERQSKALVLRPSSQVLGLSAPELPPLPHPPRARPRMAQYML